MKMLISFFRTVYSLYAIICFVALMLIVFLLSLVASLFGIIRGGNMILRLCSAWSDVWFFLLGIRSKRILMSADPKKDQQYIFVANHISYLDVPMIVNSIRQPLRALGKSQMAKLPIFGFLYRYGAILVDRESAEARKKSVYQLKSVLRKGISVFIFPEGTFNEGSGMLKSFYDGAFRIAIETQTPLMPLVFPDTIKRLHYKSIFSFTPGRCRAVFLEKVPVEGMTLRDLPALKEKVYKQMEDALRTLR